MKKILAVLILSVLGVCKCNIELTIVHTNDIHSHFEEMESRSGEKYGGIARRKTMIDELRNRADLSNVILLDSGDQFSGTLWFYKYKGQAASYFMNELQYDAMSLGNHEFDDIRALREFLGNVNFPVLCSNIDVSGEPRLKDNILPSTILDIGGNRIGVIGYITTEVEELVDPDIFENIEIKDVLESIRDEVTKLEADGVNIIIASGHAGIDMDLQIAELEGIDVVVGAHSEAFMYTGTPPGGEEPEYDYPHIVTKASGGKALVVKSPDFGKYLGFLKVILDDSGNVVEGSGKPIYLNDAVAQDAGILSQVEQWKAPVDELKKQILGFTDVRLEGERDICRQYECNLGNLITDALVHYYTVKLRAPPDAWTQTSIAIWNSGSIRHTIPKGNVSRGDILRVLQFSNTIERVEVTGATLLKVLEYSATSWTPDDLWGGFLQYAGLRVTYDRTKAEWSRVLEVYVQCADCEIPEYRPLDPAARYYLLGPTFIIKGGDGYTMLDDEALSDPTVYYGQVDSDILAEYLKERSPVMHGLEGRIRFVEEPVEPEDPEPTKDMCNYSTSVLSSVLFILACLFLNLIAM